MERSSRVVCNPLDLPYAYQDMTVPGFLRSVQREAADPSLVRYRDRYYLFVSMSGGFFHSTDLVSWEFVATPHLPILDYAPDVREIDGALVFSASRHGDPCSFWRTTDPLGGVFEELPGTFPFWDPCLFQDDDGRVYLYWGCSNVEPIRGVELDRTTFHPIGEAVDLFGGAQLQHGWERVGDTEDAPFVEGAWMTKHAGTYYLQYAAPGTEYHTYADGYYIAQHPLGPYTYATNNPFSSVPGGFAPGAGHGSTVQDEYGNWWHLATSRISVHHPFERRIGLYPAGFDDDGALFCQQSFADHPMRIPTTLVDPTTDVYTDWRLLSYGRPVVATSSLAAHDASLVVDENIQTWWVADRTGDDEGVTIDLGDGCTVHAIQVNLADHRIADAKPAPDIGDPPPPGLTRIICPIDRPVAYRVEVSVDGVAWTTAFAPSPDDLDAPHRLVTFDAPTTVRFVRVVGGPGGWGAPFAISGVRVFGHRAGDAPSAADVQASRIDGRTARITWQPADPTAPAADGANVRYGRAPDRMYHSWLVYGQRELRLPMLSTGDDYWVAVDTVNGSGITPGRAVRITAERHI